MDRPTVYAVPILLCSSPTRTTYPFPGNSPEGNLSGTRLTQPSPKNSRVLRRRQLHPGRADAQRAVVHRLWPGAGRGLPRHVHADSDPDRARDVPLAGRELAGQRHAPGRQRDLLRARGLLDRRLHVLPAARGHRELLLRVPRHGGHQVPGVGVGGVPRHQRDVPRRQRVQRHQRRQRPRRRRLLRLPGELLVCRGAQV